MADLSPDKKVESKVQDPEKVIVLLKNAGKAKQLSKPKILMKRSDKLYDITKFLKKSIGCDTVRPLPRYCILIAISHRRQWP